MYDYETNISLKRDRQTDRESDREIRETTPCITISDYGRRSCLTFQFNFSFDTTVGLYLDGFNRVVGVSVCFGC